jgi:FAD/FMN-containing dehydrogenase
MRRSLRWHDKSNYSPEKSGQLNFTAADIGELSESFVGSILLPQDPDYHLKRETFSLAFQHFPQIIVYCECVADVVRAIQFAKKTNLRPVCRSGGHSTAGYSVNDQIVIDVSRLNYVRVDPVSRTAFVGAGAHFTHVNNTLDLYGLHLPGGGCETVGVSGYMQGGGYSFTSLMFGMNCDHVVGVRMALANGDLIDANVHENSDLFWAVRGGTGNNFGVVLEIQYRLHQLGELWGFGFKWPLVTDEEVRAACEAMAVWQEHFTGKTVPEKLGNQALLVHTNGADNRLTPHFVIRGMFNGSETECSDALAPLLRIMKDKNIYRDIWQKGTYRELNAFLLTHPTELPPNVPPSARAIAKSHLVARKLSAADWGSIVELYRKSPSSDNFIGLEAFGGAINTVSPTETAFWHRDASVDVFLFSFWLHEEDRHLAESYLDEFDHVVAKHSNGQSYQNYPNRKNQNFGLMYFGGNLPRLIEVKRKYDPEDFFTFPQGIMKASHEAGL